MKLLPQKYNLGIALAISEVFLSILIAVLVKFLSEELSVFVILLFRYLFCLPLLFLIGILQRGPNIIEVENYSVLIARTSFGILGLLMWFLAIPLLGVIKATVLAQLMPLFIILLAPILLKEAVSKKKWMAILFGFIGTLIILRPDLNNWWSYGIIFGLLTPLFAALMNISLRKLGDTDWPITTAVWYNLSGAVMFFLVCFFGNYQIATDMVTIIALIIVGVISSFQQYVLATSRVYAPAITLAPVSYLMVPGSIFAGIFFFKEEITTLFFFGSLIIIGSAVSAVSLKK